MRLCRHCLLLGLHKKILNAVAEGKGSSNFISFAMPYKWRDYADKVVSMVLPPHAGANCVICVNDPYDAGFSTKDDERDMQAQGMIHEQNVYMKLEDPFPSATATIPNMKVTAEGVQHLLK